jgi:predicted Zn-dependent peptidase
VKSLALFPQPKAEQPSGNLTRGALDRSGGCIDLYKRTTLENGIRVVTERMPEVRSMALGIVVDAGPRAEATRQAGLAHLTEHLLFQGTSNRDASEIARMMDLAGGQLGGFTTRDYTCYFATVLDEHGPYALDLLGDILLNSTFPEERVEREKEAILREISAARDAPAERAHNVLKSFAWPYHPLGRPIAGWPHTVRTLSRADAIYFLHENYVPERVIIAAAGNLHHEDFVAQVRDAFWRLLGERPAAHEPGPTQQPGVVLEPMPVSQSYFCVGIPGHPYTHADRYALHVLTHLLGGGCSSRLFRQLREERGLVYGIAAEYHAYRDAGMLIVEGSTAVENTLPVLGITLTALWRLATGMEPIDEEELWRAKTQLRRQHLLAAENTNTRMSRLATQELYFGRHLPAEEVLAQIEAVDVNLLQRLAGEYLLEALPRATVAVTGPEAPCHYDTARLEELVASFADCAVLT